MRKIQISTAVFAKLWANRQDGEDTEDDILRRMLSARDADATPSITGKSSNKIDGVFDKRNSVHFPEGLRIFRNYKGNEYSAVANSGQWLREDIGKKYPSINQLNSSIAEGPENVWNGTWRYNNNGIGHSIDFLRKQIS